MTGVEDAQREEQQENCMKTIGYRTFSNEDECRGYYRHILTGCRKNQNLNEYEFHNVMKLIETAHPNAQQKLEGGVRAIQVREKTVNGRSSKCFHLMKENGKVDDVSYVKCVENLYHAGKKE